MQLQSLQQIESSRGNTLVVDLGAKYARTH